LRRAPGSDADPALGVAGSASVRAALRWHECYWQRQYVVMMRQSRGSVAGSALTDLVLEVFRLNGRLLAAGERMTRPSGQTSARWQSSAPSPRAAHCRTDCPSHGRGWQSPVVVRKKRRMRLIAANGLLILVPAAIVLHRLAAAGAFDTRPTSCRRSSSSRRDELEDRHSDSADPITAR
jgi:hypothetical protein